MAGSGSNPAANPAADPAEEMARVHTAPYLDRVAATAGVAAQLDPDTFTSPESHEIALLAAGAAPAQSAGRSESTLASAMRGVASSAVAARLVQK